MLAKLQYIVCELQQGVTPVYGHPLTVRYVRRFASGVKKYHQFIRFDLRYTNTMPD